MKKTCTLTFLALFLLKSPSFAQVSSLNEGFETVTAVTGSAAGTPVAGWTGKNNSSPIGTTGWFQGASTTFPGQAGNYIGANYNATTGANTISNWLITPHLNLQNGAVFKFWTRKPTGTTDYPDRLEVRLSTAAASVNVGTGVSDVGDFTTVLHTINPTLAAGGYPTTWTQVTITLSGITGSATGRIAFRYHVTNGGPSGANSDYIGIDEVTYTMPLPVTLFDFLATVSDDNHVQLKWKTGTEINNSHFEVERSVDGVSFSEIGRVSGKGNSSITQQYAFSDATIAKLRTVSAVYYRLKQVDLDGKYKHSNVLVAKLKKTSKLDIVNAIITGSTLTVRYDAPTQEKTTIAVYNVFGAAVSSATQIPNKGLNTYTLDAGKLAAGVYIVSIHNGNDRSTIKVIK